MRRFIAGAAAAALAAALPASAALALDAGVVRGHVFDCASGAPIAGALVRLTTDGAAVDVRSDANGRFVRVGVAPGNLTVTATAPQSWDAHAETLDRHGVLEPGDVLDVRLGMFHALRAIDAACQSPRIPAATSPVLRYIIH